MRIGQDNESHTTFSSTGSEFFDGDGATSRIRILNDGQMNIRDSDGNDRIRLNNAGLTVGADGQSHVAISPTGSDFYDGDGSTKRVQIINDGQVIILD